jgi:hypothetical protein
MSDGGSTTQTTSSNAEPWKKSQPYLEANMQQAKNLYKQGIGSQVNTASQVVPFANQTMQSMNNMEQMAGQQYGNLQKPINAYAGMIDQLNPIARGDFSGDNLFNQNLRQAQDAASSYVDQSASGVGRYGGGQHQSTMGKTIGDLTNQAMLDRQNWAGDQMRQYGGAMGNAWNTANLGNQALAGIGGNYEQLYANTLQDANRIFNESQQKPWDALAQYNSIISGAGRLGSTNSSQVSTPTTPGWQQAAGFGLSALGTMTGNPAMVAGGGLVGSM